MATAAKDGSVSLVQRVRGADQGFVVAALLVIVLLVAGVGLDRFGTADNLLNVARVTATLGILSIGMTVVVIARGLDLSIVMVMGISGVLAVVLVSQGHPEVWAFAWALGIALSMGLVNGVLVAYVEIPALFVTLSSTLLFFGVVRLVYLEDQIVTVPPSAQAMNWLGREEVLGVPNPVVVFVVVAGVMAWLLTRNVGRYLYAMGDNPEAARLAGLPVRPLTVLTYVVSAVLGFVGGIMLISVAGTFDFRTATAGTLLYDVVAVVVIGGVSLAGGRGSIFGVVAAALLIGVVSNIMTLLDFDTIQQSLAKAVIVMAAIVVDGALHPRDDETARVGEL